MERFGDLGTWLQPRSLLRAKTEYDLDAQHAGQGDFVLRIGEQTVLFPTVDRARIDANCGGQRGLRIPRSLPESNEPVSESSVHKDKATTESFSRQDFGDRNSEMSLFRERLDELVKIRFGSVASFLATTGYHKSTYYQWIRGTTLPEMAKVFEIAEHLGIPTRELFSRASSTDPDVGKAAQDALKTLRKLREQSALAELSLASALGLPVPQEHLTKLDKKLDATRPQPGSRKSK